MSCNEAFRVACVHGAAVLNDELVSSFLAVEVSNEGADEVVDFVGLLVGRGLAGADRPDRLVSDDDVREFRFGDAGQSDLGLDSDGLERDVLLSLLEGLTDAEDDLEAVVESGTGAVADGVVGLAEVLSSLRVADDDVLDAHFLQHGSGNFAGESAVGRPVAVFSADFDVGAGSLFESDLKVDIGDTDDDVAVCVCNEGLELSDERLGLGRSLVHFPVAGDDGFAKCFVHWNLPLFRLIQIVLYKRPELSLCRPLRQYREALCLRGIRGKRRRRWRCGSSCRRDPAG